MTAFATLHQNRANSLFKEFLTGRLLLPAADGHASHEPNTG
jgi:hypothetical protein